jgi:hypothetical protein
MFGFEVDGNFVLPIMLDMVVQGSIEKCIDCVPVGCVFFVGLFAYCAKNGLLGFSIHLLDPCVEC